MHVRRGFLGWGVFLILAGAVPLLVRSGVLTDDQVARLWTLWPLILVGIGVGLLLSRTRYGFLGGLIVAATFGLMVGGLLSTGVSTISTGSCGSGAATTAFPTRDGSFNGASAEVTVQLNCGTLKVTAAQGSAWRVEGHDRDGAGPEIDADDVSLQVRPRDRTDAPFAFFGQRDDWTVTLPGGPTIDLNLKLNAGSSTAMLGGATIGIVDIDLNAGASTVNLSEVAAIERLEGEQVADRIDPGERRRREAVRAGGRGPSPAHGREQPRVLRLRRSWTRRRRLDVDEPGLRHGRGPDRPRDPGEPGFVHPRPGWWL